MQELGIVRDLALVWLAALLAGYLCLRFKQPVIAGYILAGLVLGPYGSRLVNESEDITLLSELGVALLLFALGVELSLRHIFKDAQRVILAGLLQIGATALVACSLGYLCNLFSSWSTGILFGFICALSSTVVVTKLLTDRGETDTTHGRLLVPILLIQDLSLVPVISLVPVMQQATGESWLLAVAIALGKATALVAFVVFGSTKLIPPLLAWVSRFNSREIFLLTAISLCLLVAVTSQQIGLSLALGAFLAGIMISEYPYGHQALADVIPLRDLFAVVFFVSIGMRIDPIFISSHLLEVCLFVVALVVGKMVIGSLSAMVAVRSLSSALLVGIALSQIGEFSFVVASLGHSVGLISPELFNLFLAGAVVTLIATPLLMTAAPQIVARLNAFQVPEDAARERKAGYIRMHDHVILCGFGRIGRNVGLVLQAHSIPFAVIEVNGALVQDLRDNDIPHIYGDAFSRLVLTRANIKNATCLILTIPDPVVTTTIITLAREINPDIKIIARAHQTVYLDIFRTAGANAVVQPEFEASVEITRLAFLSLQRPGDEIQTALQDIRTRRYSVFRPDITEPELSHLIDLQYGEVLGLWFVVSPELDGASIKKLDVRRRTGATIVAIRRQQNVIPHPAPETQLQTSDQLYIAGNDEQLDRFERAFGLPRFCPTAEATSDEISK